MKGKGFLKLKEAFVDKEEMRMERRHANLAQLSNGFAELSRKWRWDLLFSLAVAYDASIEKVRRFGHSALDAVLDAITIEDARAPIAPVYPRKESFSMWRRFHIGGTVKEDLVLLVQSVGMLNSETKMLLERSALSIQPEQEEVDTIVLTPIDLMLLGEEEIPTTTAQWLNKERLTQWNKENVARLPHGYIIDLLPAEAGLYVRTQYPDQPSGESMVIATPRIMDSGPGDRLTPYLLCVKRHTSGGKQSLQACRALPDTSWWPPIAQKHIAPPHILFRLRRVL